MGVSVSLSKLMVYMYVLLRNHLGIFHHHVRLLAWISLTLAIRIYHPSLKSGLLDHSMFLNRAVACLCDRVHRTSLMSLFLFLQQCPACLLF